ncbi:MAG: flagellar biosynthetic protein FliO [bacterium]
MREKIGYYILVLTSFIFFFPNCALGQNKYLEYNQPNEVNSPNLFWELTKVILALAFVIGVAYFLLQFLNKKNFIQSKNEILDVLESIYIAPNRMVCLLKVGDKILVLGVTENNISFLTEINDLGIKETLQAQKDLKAAPIFAEQLNEVIEKIKVSPQQDEKKTKNIKSHDITDEYSNLQSYFQEQLKKIKVGDKKESREEQK